MIPKQESMADNNHILKEIGDMLTNKITERDTRGDITIFKVPGLAIEDIAAAHYVCEYEKTINTN